MTGQATFARLAALRAVERWCEEERKALAAELTMSLASGPSVVTPARLGQAIRALSVRLVGHAADVTHPTAVIALETDTQRRPTLAAIVAHLGADDGKALWNAMPVKQASYVAVRFIGGD